MMSTFALKLCKFFAQVGLNFVWWWSHAASKDWVVHGEMSNIPCNKFASSTWYDLHFELDTCTHIVKELKLA